MDKNGMTPEFSFVVPLSEIGGKAVLHRLVTDAAQRAALARRFALLSLQSLSAEVSLARDGEVISAQGKLAAELSQACVATGSPVKAKVAESFDIRFVTDDAKHALDAEIELGESDCDTMFHDGRIIDLGEVVAQTLGLAINPYPRIPNADTALKNAGVKGEHEAGPFAALAALRQDSD